MKAIGQGLETRRAALETRVVMSIKSQHRRKDSAFSCLQATVALAVRRAGFQIQSAQPHRHPLCEEATRGNSGALIGNTPSRLESSSHPLQLGGKALQLGGAGVDLGAGRR